MDTLKSFWEQDARPPRGLHGAWPSRRALPRLSAVKQDQSGSHASRRGLVSWGNSMFLYFMGLFIALAFLAVIGKTIAVGIASDRVALPPEPPRHHGLRAALVSGEGGVLLADGRTHPPSRPALTVIDAGNRIVAVYSVGNYSVPPRQNSQSWLKKRYINPHEIK